MTPVASRPAPSQSTVCSRRGTSTRKPSQTTTRASAPKGRLTKNAQRQLVLSAIQPPVAGPTTDATPNTAPVSPCHLPRSRGAIRSPITAIASGIKPPAPSPWIARPAISIVIDCASPQTTAPPMKRTIPSAKNGRRP